MPIRRLLAAMAVLVAIASCGDDDAVTAEAEAEVATADEQVTLTLRFTQDVSEEDRQTTARVLDARLDGAGLTGATIDVDEDGVTVEVSGDDAGDADSIAGPLTEPGALEFRPVLGTLPPDVAPSCSSDGSVAVAGELLPELDGPGGEPVVCHDLGPAEATGAIIADATAEQAPGSWQVAIQLRPGPDGVDIFNAVAGSCFDRGPSCPSGQLAIVLDGVVVSAPTIQQPTFDDRGISLTGPFTQADADQLAVVLRSGALPVGLVVDEEGGA